MPLLLVLDAFIVHVQKFMLCDAVLLLCVSALQAKELRIQKRLEEVCLAHLQEYLRCVLIQIFDISQLSEGALVRSSRCAHALVA